MVKYDLGYIGGWPMRVNHKLSPVLGGGEIGRGALSRVS